MKDYYALGNSLIQVSGMLIYQYFGIAWAMYPSMLLLLGIIIVQTMGAAYLFTTKTQTEKHTGDDEVSNSVAIFLSFVYMISTYQILLMGFPIFAGLCFAHISILLLTRFMKVFYK